MPSPLVSSAGLWMPSITSSWSFVYPPLRQISSVAKSAVTEAYFLTLAFRPLGALLFGWMADRFGRRPTLMVNILCYSVLELACAFTPSLHVLLVLRALFGIAMGGEWGVGAAMAFETLPKENRGFFSGLLQEGYAVGYLVAAAVFGLLFQTVGWRGMFIVGAHARAGRRLHRFQSRRIPGVAAGQSGTRHWIVLFRTMAGHTRLFATVPVSCSAHVRL